MLLIFPLEGKGKKKNPAWSIHPSVIIQFPFTTGTLNKAFMHEVWTEFRWSLFKDKKKKKILDR